MSSKNFSIDPVTHLLQAKGAKYKVDTSNYITTKNNTKFSKGQCDALIIHYTAGRDGLSSARHLADANIKASAHLVVNKDGSVIQVVPFDTIAWHAGRSFYDGRKGYNKFSLGIELDNPGILTPAQNGFVSWFGKSYKPENVIQAVHRNEKSPRYWHTFTEDQILVCEEISDLLIQTYGLKQILGHEEISPGRKQDPGPAFPLDKMRDKILGDTREVDTDDDNKKPKKGKVAASRLNIRNAPSTTGTKVALPLGGGKPVTILEEKGDWIKVSTEIQGWVSKQYIEITETE